MPLHSPPFYLIQVEPYTTTEAIVGKDTTLPPLVDRAGFDAEVVGHGVVVYEVLRGGVRRHSVRSLDPPWRDVLEGPLAAGMRPVYLKRTGPPSDNTAPPPAEYPADVVVGSDLTALLDAVS